MGAFGQCYNVHRNKRRFCTGFSNSALRVLYTQFTEIYYKLSHVIKMDLIGTATLAHIHISLHIEVM